jgi:hypothetical protein
MVLTKLHIRFQPIRCLEKCLQIIQLRQKCYKRVDISWHITYLTLSTAEAREDTEVDRVRIFPFRHLRDPAKSGYTFLEKASSSVLLTLCTPEESVSREEEVCLLKTPQALWAVLVFNCASEFVSNHRAKQYLTPITQYVRGITSTICTQRINSESIYEYLKKWLKDSDLDSIFDDEHFTKSTSYHWAVKTCDELDQSISSTLRLIRRRMENQVDKLGREVHECEKVGIDYWTQQMKEEIFALEELLISAQTHSANLQ